MHDTEPFLGHQ